MEIRIEVRVPTAYLDGELAALEAALQGALDFTLKEMADIGRSLAPKQSGFLSMTHFAASPRFNEYSEALARAHSINPNKAFGHIVMDLTDPYRGYVWAGANYAAAVNFGFLAVRRNSTRLGLRSGKVGVALAPGVFATFSSGKPYMEDLAYLGQIMLRQNARQAVRNALRRPRR